MPRKMTYTLGSSAEEQKRLLEQQRLYGDANYLTFKETDTVCEVGCGAGANLWVASKLPGGNYIGIDNQPNQIEACQQKAKALSLNNVEFYCADARELPLKDAMVDTAFCRLVLIHFPDPESVLREMFRITKLGGQIIAIEPEVMAYKITKPALMKCFLARVNYIYREGYGSIEIATHLDAIFHRLGCKNVEVIEHEIFATGRENKEKLIGLLSNLYALNKPVAAHLLKKKYLTQDDLTQAERELTEVNDDDSVYQRLWIVKGVKLT